MDIRQYCEERSLTLQAFSQALNIDYNYFIVCLNGYRGRKFSMDNARAIQEYTKGKVSIEEIIPKTIPRKKFEQEVLRRLEILEKKIASL